MRTRAQAIDALRGLALIAMIAYHACWFAAHAGLLTIDFRDLGWHVLQRSIAASFFLLVGVGLALAGTPKPNAHQVIARFLRIAACAAVVTLTSVVLDPRRIVTFGILHNIALSSLLALPLLPLGAWNLLLGAVLVGAGLTISIPGHPLLDWTGLGARPGPTFDFQPLLPWLGVALWGVAIGTVLVGPRGETIRAWSSRAAPVRGLAFLGRHSLLVYMAHVPILLGVTRLLAEILR